jgi:hypothetical protein
MATVDHFDGPASHFVPGREDGLVWLMISP